MSARKTPILLRRAAVSGGINALHSYTRKSIRGDEVLDAGMNGKQDVTADFDGLVCELLLEESDPWMSSPDIIRILDDVARGHRLTIGERAEVRAFCERLKAIIVRHNTTGHGAESSTDRVLA